MPMRFDLHEFRTVIPHSVFASNEQSTVNYGVTFTRYKEPSVEEVVALVQNRAEVLFNYINDFDQPPGHYSKLDDLMLKCPAFAQLQEPKAETFLKKHVPIERDNEYLEFAHIRAGTIMKYLVGAGESENMKQVWYDQHLKPRWSAPVPLNSKEPIMVSAKTDPVWLEEITASVGLFYSVNSCEDKMNNILDTSSARLEAAAYLTLADFLKQ